MNDEWLNKQLEDLGLTRRELPTAETWQEFLDRLEEGMAQSQPLQNREQDPAPQRSGQKASSSEDGLSLDTRYKAIVEDQTEFINRYTPEGVITFVNEAYARLHNTRPEAMIGKRHGDFMDADDAAMLETIRRQLTVDSPVVTTENRFEKPDGEVMWLQWRDRVICNAEGQPIEYQGVGRDITESKRTEAALRESEEKFRTLAEKSPNMIFINQDGRIVYANDACEEIMGYSREEYYAPDFHFMNLIAPDCRQTITEHFKQHNQGEDVPPYESVLLTKDGRRLNAIHATRLINYEGQSAILGIVTDVSDRKRAEEAQSRRVAELRMLNEISQKITSVLDMDSVLSRTVELVQSSFDYHHVGIFILDPSHHVLRMRARAGRYVNLYDENHQLNLGEGIVGTAVETNTTILVPDVSLDPRYVNRYPDVVNSRSELAIPIRVGGRVLGVLDIQSDRVDAFDEHDSIVMETLVDQIAASIEHARLYGEVQRELDERRRVESRLSLLVTALESAANSVVITDRDGVIEWVNHAFVDLTGFSSAEAIGRNLNILKSGQHPTSFYKEMWDTILSGQSWQGELLNRRKDGTLYHEEQTITPVKGPDGQITHFIAVKQDITDRRISERRIQQQADDLKLLNDLNDAINRGTELTSILNLLSQTTKGLFNSMGATIYLLTEDGRYLTAQAIGLPDGILSELVDLTGQPKLQHRLRFEKGSVLDSVLANQEPLVFNDPEDCKKLLQKIIQTADARRTLKAGLLTKRIPEVLNRLPLQAISLVPLVSEGQALGLMLMGRDQPFSNSDVVRMRAIASSVTSAISRKAQEEALRISEANYRNIFEGVQDAILVLGMDHGILDANSRACELYGYDRAQLLQMNLAELEEAGQASILPEEMQAAGMTETVVESTHRRSDGTTFPVEISARARQLGTETVMLTVVRNLTEARLAQERAQLQSRLAAVGQLAAGIAHDFNNILGTILLYAELMLNNQTLSEKDRERLNTIFSQAKRGANLTAQVLDFSRRSVMERHAIDLVPFFEELESLLSRTLPESVQLSFETQARGSFVVDADPTRMQQVIMNLALNARDAMPKGGQLRFGLSEQRIDPTAPPFPGMEAEQWIRIDVIDTGEGIPDDVMPHIFEPFFTTKPAGEGTGLGLAQVYGIIKQHGGFIDAGSKVGEGTCFTIYLPAVQETEGSSPPADIRQTGNGAGETILVVEDDEATRAAVAEILESLGYSVITVADGQEALNTINASGDHLDLVLSDLVMPKMGGRDLYYAVKQDFPHLKMILMTGYPLGGQTRELLDRERVAWLQKPLTSDLLAIAVRDMLQSSVEKRTH
ncbi:MAG: PAS domain S-box protein [Anaerolineales bacterium]